MATCAPSGSLARGDDETDPDRTLLDRLQTFLELLKRSDHGEFARSDDWDRFFGLYTASFLRLVRARHWPQAECEDGVQELWLTIVGRLAGLVYDGHRGRLDDWIMATARNRAADLERRRRQRSMDHLSVSCERALPGREADPAIAFDRNCLQELVRDALAELRPLMAPPDFEAFLLHWYEGLTIQEISQRLGRSEAQIWSGHHRLTEKLRALLARRLGIGATAWPSLARGPWLEGGAGDDDHL